MRKHAQIKCFGHQLRVRRQHLSYRLATKKPENVEIRWKTQGHIRIQVQAPTANGEQTCAYEPARRVEICARRTQTTQVGRHVIAAIETIYVVIDALRKKTVENPLNNTLRTKTWMNMPKWANASRRDMCATDTGRHVITATETTYVVFDARRFWQVQNKRDRRTVQHTLRTKTWINMCRWANASHGDMCATNAGEASGHGEAHSRRDRDNFCCYRCSTWMASKKTNVTENPFNNQ